MSLSPQPEHPSIVDIVTGKRRSMTPEEVAQVNSFKLMADQNPLMGARWCHYTRKVEKYYL